VNIHTFEDLAEGAVLLALLVLVFLPFFVLAWLWKLATRD
jgi:hypothetical protein